MTRNRQYLSRRTFASSVMAGTALASTRASGLAAQPEASGGVRLAYYMPGDAWVATFDEVVAGFRSAHPEIDLEVEPRPSEEYWNKIQVEYAGGTAPDITIMNMDWVVPGAARGMFTDLTPFFERDQVDLSAYWYPHDREWAWKGGMYGGLLYAGGDAIYVNKDLLTAAGLEMPDATWTWDDLVQYGTALTNKEASQWGLYIASINPPFTGANFVHGAGGTVLNDARDACTLNTPEAREGLQFLADLILEKEIMASPEAVEGQTNPFMTGKVGIYFGGTWDEVEVRTGGFEWDFLPMPAHPTTGIRAVSTDSNAWSMLSTSENQDAAWEVIKYLIGPEAQRGLMTLGIPVLTEVVESTEFTEAHAPQAIDTVVTDFAEIGHDIYPTPDSSEWWDAVDQELSVVWSGEATVEEATQRATDRVDEIFSRRPAEWSE